MLWRQLGVGRGRKARSRAGLRPRADGGRVFLAEGTPEQCSEDGDRVCVAASPLPEEGWVRGARPGGLEGQDEHPPPYPQHPSIERASRVCHPLLQGATPVPGRTL